MTTNIQFWSSCSGLRRTRNVSDRSCRENQNTLFFGSINIFPRKLCRLWDNVEKYCRAGQVTDDNMAHAHCMLDTKEYKYTLVICNTYCLSAETTVARTRLNVTFMPTLPVLFCTPLCKERTCHGLFPHILILVLQNFHHRGAQSSNQGGTPWRIDTCDFTEATERSPMDIPLFHLRRTVTFPPPPYSHVFFCSHIAMLFTIVLLEITKR